MTSLPEQDLHSLERRRETAVDQLRQHLKRAIQESNWTQRAVEENNGFTRGYLSQVLQGHVTLTARHLFGILFSLDISPVAFFDQVFGQSPPRPDDPPLSEIRERIARYDAALRQLEEKGVLTPADPPERSKTKP